METITASYEPETVEKETADIILSVVVLDTLSSLTQYADSWNALAIASPQGIPALSYAWIASWLETMLQENQTWKCFLALRGKEVVGVLPVVATEGRILGLKQVRLSPPNDLHTFSTDILCRPEQSREITDALYTAMAKAFPGFYRFSLTRIPEHSPTIPLYQSGYQSNRAVLEQYDVGSYLPIANDYETYIKSLNNNFSRNLRRAQRKLEELSAEPHFITDSARNNECLSQYLKLEAAGWKGKNDGGAILLSESLVKFYTRLSERLIASGMLEWQILEIDGKPIAVHFVVTCGQKHNLLKITYDETYGSYSPGSVLLAHMIRRAYDTRALNEINFHSSGRWQANWRVDTRKYYAISVYSSSPASYLCGYLPARLRAKVRNTPWMMEQYRKLRDRWNGTTKPTPPASEAKQELQGTDTK